MDNFEGGPEGRGISPEEMKTPEQREIEHSIVMAVVLRRLGKPREGEEEQNQAIADKYAADVVSRLAQEGIGIPENVNLAPEEDRLICAP